MVINSWWDSWLKDIAPYAVLLRLFISGACNADEFEIVFMRLYLEDDTNWRDDIFKVLDGLFAVVDSYCPDDDLRAQVGGADSAQLRLEAEKAFEALRAIAS